MNCGYYHSGPISNPINQNKLKENFVADLLSENVGRKEKIHHCQINVDNTRSLSGKTEKHLRLTTWALADNAA